MNFTPHGKHLIAGEWIETQDKFQSEQADGASFAFSMGSVELVDQACEAAEEAFLTYAATTRTERAAFINKIADEIELRGAEITQIGTAETGLPAARLEGERGRTTGQLRLFAQHIQNGDYLDRRHDDALPDRAPMARPDLRLMQRPIGPVAVFGASNFPLAFSTAGGDTASALAAGCPVVVKGHQAHPGTGEIVAEAIHAAITACGLPSGVFSFVQGNTVAVGQRLVQHSLIKAVGFTGSLGGGRALFDLCAQRDEPIPFFGELGSVNPVFLMPEAASNRGAALGEAWAGSLTMGVGQFCTNPGVVVVVDGPEADAFASAASRTLEAISSQTMLSDGIASAYRSGHDQMARTPGVTTLLHADAEPRCANPALFETSGATFLANTDLSEEVFGPLGLIVRVSDGDEMTKIAKSLDGQLTCTLLLDDGDTDAARALVPVLERKAGRILVNGFPTGVEVADAMVHGGPYPASTNFGATSVGTMAIRRFLRPVCYQNLPDALLPADLRG